MNNIFRRCERKLDFDEKTEGDIPRENCPRAPMFYNDDDKVFYGKLEFIRALVSYEGTDIVSLRKAFEEAVDDYLEFCKEQGRQPEKPFKGTFNIRLDPDLHKRLVTNAMNEGKTLNAFVKDVLQKAVSETHA